MWRERGWEECRRARMEEILKAWRAFIEERRKRAKPQMTTIPIECILQLEDEIPQ